MTRETAMPGLRPLSPAVGMEVTGVDLSNATDKDIVFSLEAFQAHSALLFRNQRLSNEDLISFSEKLGAVVEAPEVQRQKTVPGMPKIYVISNIRNEKGKSIGSFGSGEAIWHSDNSNREIPPYATLLYSLEVPPSGGDTWIASMISALEDMPDELRRRIEGRFIKHDGTYNAAGYIRKGVEDSDNPVTCAGRLHPAICVHPETGKPALYLGRRRNAYVDGLELAESESLLDALWAHATSGAYCYVHRWRKGDLLMWDNRATLHRRDEFNPAHRRKMLRTLIMGVTAPRAA